MVRLPRDITTGARARRALLADTLAAALLALVAILVSAGIGVVGFGALAVFLVLVAWAAVEFLLRLILRRRRTAAESGSRRIKPTDEPDRAVPRRPRASAHTPKGP
jgi:uncharacterized membrane protein YhiD involved in acid resistance